MVKLSSIISIRNAIRCSGIITIMVGAPMVVIPPLAVKFFCGKREDTKEHDKEALNLTIQALGVALTATGAKALVVPASKKQLIVSICQDAAFGCWHLCNALCGKWKDAKCRMAAAYMFSCLCLTGGLCGTLSLCFGDEPDEEEEEKKD